MSTDLGKPIDDFSAGLVSLQSEIIKATRLTTDYVNALVQGSRKLESASSQSQLAMVGVSSQLVSVRSTAMAVVEALTPGDLTKLTAQLGDVSARLKFASMSTVEFSRSQSMLMVQDTPRGKEVNPAKDNGVGVTPTQADGKKTAEDPKEDQGWLGGLSKGLGDWAKTASNYSEQVAAAGKNAMGGMVNNIAEMLNGNKGTWREWASSVAGAIGKIMLNMAIVESIKGMGSFLSGFGGGLGKVGDFFSSVVPHAKGGVYDSPSLSAFSNGIVSSPTYFAFAKGMGLMGEAGPEAIMPLTRAADGSLGVRAVGGRQTSLASAGGGAPIVTINIDSNGGVATSAPSGFEQFGSEIGAFVDNRYRALIGSDLGQGGRIARAIKGGR
ncbi:phage tail tape measure protein [Serratia aquatilis]|uniref:Phage tail tape measure protein n=1 Tax=Serratia aquatilis TaxID=1737515 RepID=A0ABV6EGE0_9GAMM